jgi:hypothetical protein
MRIYSHLLDISFLPVCGYHSSLTLKPAVLHHYDNQDSALLDVSDISIVLLAFVDGTPTVVHR